MVGTWLAMESGGIMWQRLGFVAGGNVLFSGWFRVLCGCGGSAALCVDVCGGGGGGGEGGVVRCCGGDLVMSWFRGFLCATVEGSVGRWAIH